MSEKVFKLLEKFTKNELIDLMYSALDEMQSYNGRTKLFCIMTALGAKLDEEKNMYTLPTMEQMKENLVYVHME